jgi:hypothetical protein
MREGVPDFIGSSLLVVLGAAFVVGSLQFEIVRESGEIGPGFMPFVSGILLVVFGAMVGVGTWWRVRPTDGPDQSRETPEAEPEEDAQSEDAGSQEDRWRYSVGPAFGLLAVAILLIPVLGFLVSFGLLMFALVRFVEQEKTLSAALLSVGAVAAAWLIFIRFLQIPLPEGFFGQIFGG